MQTSDDIVQQPRETAVSEVLLAAKLEDEVLALSFIEEIFRFADVIARLRTKVAAYQQHIASIEVVVDVAALRLAGKLVHFPRGQEPSNAQDFGVG